MNVIQGLQASRALISEPGTWITGYQHKVVEGKNAYCAAGAVVNGALGAYFEVWGALTATLQRRFKAGTLPTPTFGNSNGNPRPWALVLREGSMGAGIAQFNNSTSQAAVLDLFDETIAFEQAKEAGKKLPLLDFSPKAKPVKAPVRELELA